MSPVSGRPRPQGLEALPERGAEGPDAQRRSLPPRGGHGGGGGDGHAARPHRHPPQDGEGTHAAGDRHAQPAAAARAQDQTTDR